MHGSKYVYTNTEYTNAISKVNIECRRHGTFLITPNNHLRGKGCAKCKFEKLSSLYSFDFLSVIKAANRKHNCTYSYKDISYENLDSVLSINCSLHGDFNVSARSHLQGTGCKICGRINTLKSREVTTKSFIEKAKLRHINKYDYRLVEYYKAKTNIKIICNQCENIFEQTPDCHLSGQGCPRCVISGFSKGKPGTFYILVSDSLIKVGITNREVNLRVKSISKSSGKDFKVHTTLFSEDGSKVSNIETQVLNWLKSKYQAVTEVFDGSTECFIDVNLEELLNFVTQFQTPELQSSL